MNEVIRSCDVLINPNDKFGFGNYLSTTETLKEAS